MPESTSSTTSPATRSGSAGDDPRELTLDEAVEIAVALQKQDDLAAAHELYRRVLDANPHHADALHFSGVLAHQQGRDEDAIALIERSLAVAPDRADCYSNLGIVFQSAGRIGEAIEAYRRAIALESGHANAHNNLGVLLRATGNAAGAETEYRTAIALDPGHLDAYTNLGILLNGLKRTSEAAACFSKVITLRPKHKEARRLLALAHCTLGDTPEAVKIFEEWLAEEPADPIARHMWSACTGREVPPRASNAFVERTFDGFAASFESKLERLSYRAPVLVARSLSTSGIEPAKALDVLDAGCGTGLCGPLVASYARCLTGVDLSEGMLSRANEKGVYDALIKGELTSFLRDHPNAFDVIVSADTLVYFGALDEVIAAVVQALRPNGVVIFTLEHDEKALAGEGPRLQYHGRYSHPQAYVERVVAAAGLSSVIDRAELRMEAGTPVPGLVVRARRIV